LDNHQECWLADIGLRKKKEAPGGRGMKTLWQCTICEIPLCLTISRNFFSNFHRFVAMVFQFFSIFNYLLKLSAGVESSHHIWCEMRYSPWDNGGIGQQVVILMEEET
jgi:hypothetical protein